MSKLKSTAHTGVWGSGQAAKNHEHRVGILGRDQLGDVATYMSLRASSTSFVGEIITRSALTPTLHSLCLPMSGYGKPDEVRTINFMGKLARRGRFEGRKPSWKKAYVTLKHGEKPVDYGEAI